ncbi:MAG: penicillin-binding transpeptidase domain-containing protein [Candidatus Zixiibacteriota bacterium]
MVHTTKTRKLEAVFTRRRHLLVAIAVCVWGVLWLRAVQLQLVNRTTLADVAIRQSDRKVRLVAPRGEILDARGRLLAINVGTESFFAYPNRESTARLLATKFAPLTGERVNRLAANFDERSDRFTWMLRRCDETTAERVKSWKLPGVHATGEYRRDYPCVIPGATDPVGFVGDGLNGLSGLELAYDDMLKGIDGEGVLVADATGRHFAIDPVPITPLQAGSRLRLTLDWNWQSILTEELAKAVDQWSARSGMALLMNPHTGGIIAMADYDPAGPGRSSPKCRLISDVIEPGSAFKIIPFAGALSDGVITLDRYFDCENGEARFSNRTLHDDKKHGVLSAAEVFVVSSNIGTAKIANLMQPGRLDYWARRFGFGDTTGIDLLGESAGRIATQKASAINIATLSIGHGVAVTPLQLASAAATIANGGYRIRPHLVDAIEHPNGKVTKVPAVGTRILRPEVAHLMKGLMAGVVREGTAKQIWDPEFPIAGKTGTAEKPNLQTRSYDKSKFMAVFVGFYPADRPEIVGLVILDEPKGVHYGGYTAAPVLLSTIKQGIGLGDERPTDDEPAGFKLADTRFENQDAWTNRLVNAVAPMISVVEARAAGANGTGADAPLDAERAQRPAAHGGTNYWEKWSAVRDEAMAATNPEPDTWPDCRGLNLRDALSLLRGVGAICAVDGAGVVAAQDPPPQTPLSEKRVCRLTLR